MGTREIVRECVAVKLISNITVIPLSIDCILRISGTTIGGILGLLAGWVNGPAFNGANYFMLELISCLWGVYHYIAVPEPARKGPVGDRADLSPPELQWMIFLASLKKEP